MRILIIGGTSGIGYYVAKSLEKRGHKVIIGTHTKGECNNLKKKIENERLNIDVYKIDICDNKDLNILSRIDYDVIWLNQAIGIGGAILSVKDEYIKKIFETNVICTTMGMQKAYTNMSKKNKKGKIIVTSSLIKNLDLEYLGLYAASKAALSKIGFTASKELKKINSKISITILELGAYHTGFNQVMIDNKESCMNNNEFYKYNSKITKKQQTMFSLIEKNNYKSLSKTIVKLIERDAEKKIIKKPIFQALFTKLYDFFMH